MTVTTAVPEKAISAILDGDDVIIADIGAANGLPENLRPLAGIARILFFEPDREAAKVLQRELVESGHAGAQVLAVALAGTDGPRSFYITNVPTGSSLLKPGSEFFHTFGNPDYFYPVREVTVETRRLDGVLAENQLPRLDFLKIDTQGAELEILQGLGRVFTDQTLCVELEIGYPGSYVDQPGFGQLDAMITEAGFYLFDLRLASADRHHKGDGDYYRREIFHVAKNSQSITKRIGEADAVYFRRTDQVLAQKDAAVARRLMVMMCIYGFFIDAYILADDAQAAGLLSGEQAEACRRAICDWHGATCDVLLDSPAFPRISSFLSRAWRFWQKRLLGRRFHRWQT
jgi:FkbM family methyltransferase